MKTLAYIYFDELGSRIIRCEEEHQEKHNNPKRVENLLLAIAGIMIVIICIIF